jgi:hypothetical protein
VSTLLEGLSVLQTGEGGMTRMHGLPWENPFALCPEGFRLLRAGAEEAVKVARDLSRHYES